MNTNSKFTIALPKGRILDVVLPILSNVGIKPEVSFFDNQDRKLRFSTNIKNIDIIRVRSFDVVTFLAYGAAQMAFVG
ncbi:MAG: ATP phosphoribosyltransferase, partial [Candidatus Puniceispirillales bacterium]